MKMDPATAAVMVLLQCSPVEGSVCKPVDMAPTMYASLDLCMASLKDRLASAPNGETVGRCRLVDTTVTDGLPVGYTRVFVTRGLGDDAITSSYVVQRER
ncbi:hypothetical protein CK228_13490 [Mesorhizobium sp. WSM4312]|nr:hypothetical protein CK232_00605 [Mesorhizobium sp. WSM4304]PBB68283.1 hypothetical protein CK228_13490 [Mesorhizobium sp. WSM4312]PBB75557.1 hypothetical protein CK227_11815 [Mesorhizobium sp. WSM4308]PBC23075.1 hypothetical protein CK226_07745 [Mesorhizobium sp. WSM4311]TRD06415.1 hypothetical protein FJV82_06555 [Mesorhizobium sp. WSM4305]